MSAPAVAHLGISEAELIELENILAYVAGESEYRQLELRAGVGRRQSLPLTFRQADRLVELAQRLIEAQRNHGPDEFIVMVR